jgi:tetratricopeptide (TPR) repeat protein
LALGLYDDALIDFTNALKLDKNDAEAYLNRANAKAGLGQQKEALEDY